MTDLEAHPVADLFPMLAADELAELAADIKLRGLAQPIVLDSEGRILDGRNRLAACELAGVTPDFETYDGDDPDGYALAVNINRRHMTKGQQAMVAAKANSVSRTYSPQRVVAAESGVSQSRIRQASVVLEHAPDMADAVIAGAAGLDEAYRVARERKTAADSAENQLARLRAEDPELADKVVEGDLSLRGAFAELAERQRKRDEQQRDARDLLTRILGLATPPSMTADYVDTWSERLGDLDAELIKRTEQAGQLLLDLAERKRR